MATLTVCHKVACIYNCHLRDIELPLMIMRQDGARDMHWLLSKLTHVLHRQMLMSAMHTCAHVPEQIHTTEIGGH